jgi:hypothetical protein
VKFRAIKNGFGYFDSAGFDLKHFMQINVGIELAKLISTKFSSNLEKIKIINPTIYVSATIIYNLSIFE